MVLGAGLVGSLLSILLARRGHQVSLYEKRPDLRVSQWEDGRTINLAMSERGWRALRLVGLEPAAKEFAIPMRGRMMHDPAGNLTFQPYGTNGECIYSVSRSLLNRLLMNLAEEEGGVNLHFEQKCTGVDLPKAAVEMTDLRTGTASTVQADFLFGADGAFSAVRTAMMRHNRFNYEQHFIEHGYKNSPFRPGPTAPGPSTSTPCTSGPAATSCSLRCPTPTARLPAPCFSPSRANRPSGPSARRTT
jgi:kynurenine 3-monooxygenase